MEVDVFEWDFACCVEAKHDHARYPTVEEVSAGFHETGWVEAAEVAVLEIVCSNEWPLSAREPGVEGVFFTLVGFAVDHNAFFVDVFIEDPVIWVGDVLKGWYWNAPRYLSRQIPVVDIFEILAKDVFSVCREKGDFVIVESLEGSFSKWLDT